MSGSLRISVFVGDGDPELKAEMDKLENLRQRAARMRMLANLGLQALKAGHPLPYAAPVNIPAQQEPQHRMGLPAASGAGASCADASDEAAERLRIKMKNSLGQ